MNECNIVRDLLPLYADDLASDDSVEFIDRHTENCPQCREIWRRYKGELPITHPPVPEREPEDYIKPIRWGVMKIVWKVVGHILLVAALFCVFILYCGWEIGFFPVLKSFPAPTGGRSIELVDRETSGFITRGEGTILKFNLGYGVNRYETEWEDVDISWAPNGMTSFLTIESKEGETELRIVDHTDYVNGGSVEIPGLIPSEEEPDLTYVLAELCKTYPEFPTGWETITFAFSVWGSDSETVSLSFETDTGESGFLDYHYPSSQITNLYN